MLTKLRFRYILGIIAVFLFIAGMVAALTYWLSLTEVIFNINETQQTVRVRANTVEEALAAAHVTLDATDIITPAELQTPLSDTPSITIDKAQQVAINHDGVLQRVYTRALDPLQILSEINMMPIGNETLLVDGVPQHERLANTPPRIIQLLNPFTVLVQDEGITIQVTTRSDTVAGALRTSGITLYLADRIEPSLDTPLTQDMHITIHRSTQIRVVMDGQQFESRAHGERVADLLPQLGIILSGQDFVVPSENTPIEDNMRLRVVRVRDDILIQSRTIPHETIRQLDATLSDGQEHILQSGEDGMMEERIRIRYEDGREVSRVVLDSWVVTAPLDEIIAYGN